MGAKLLQKVESIYARTFERGVRTVGITGPQERSGVSTFARSLIAHCALSGQKSLLVDLSSGLSGKSQKASYAANDSRADDLPIRQTNHGYDILSFNPAKDNNRPFNNTQKIHNILRTDLIDYKHVVVDLLPVPITPTSVQTKNIEAAACDAVILVCHTCATTRSAIEAAIRSLSENNTKIAGLMMNNQHRRTMVDEIQREMERISSLLPRKLRNLIARRSDESATLRA